MKESKQEGQTPERFQRKRRKEEGWRAGTSIFRTLYLDGDLVGVMDTPELAAAVIGALRARPVVQEVARELLETCAPGCGEMGRCAWCSKREELGARLVLAVADSLQLTGGR